MIKIVTILSIIFTACSPIVYQTNYIGGFDPLYDIKKAKTIGFTPFSWTPWSEGIQSDELFEKQLFAYARAELQSRGFIVSYISQENLEYDSDISKKAVYVKSSYNPMPDLVLTVTYDQGKSNVVHVPGQSAGYLGVDNGGGRGMYAQSEGYDVQAYSISLTLTLWSGSPKFMNKVWQGGIAKGRPKMDLYEQAQYLTQEIFEKKISSKSLLNNLWSNIACSRLCACHGACGKRAKRETK